MTYSPGPGDSETWGPVTNHPNDPRNDECPHCGSTDDPECCIEQYDADFEPDPYEEPDHYREWAGVEPDYY